MKPIHIIGGGLAGLSLGVALRRAGVPVTITEAADYPRHRVCGEFISGAGQHCLEDLGLGDLLADAVPNRQTAWFNRNRRLFSDQLPVPALGLSRYQLDQRLARRFQELGGDLMTRTRITDPPDLPGVLWASGRGSDNRPKWIGLKLHCRNLRQDSDLAMHLGTHGYVGISRIEEGKMNICGLFRIRRGLSPGKSGILVAYLKANGLTAVADEIAGAGIDPDSITATTALRFTATPWPAGVACIGDANTAIPPFAGNGMSMAMESAAMSLPYLVRYARGEHSWRVTRHELRETLTRRFRLRLAAARLLHPILLQPAGQRVLSCAVSSQLLSFKRLYRLLR